ncbi:MAG: hypothetical protein J6C97_05195, partial [Clostridia bacterium]|nr:hypothetical protein [Clostridia bacterium]
GCNNNQNVSSNSSISSSSSSGFTSEELSNATTYTLNVKYHAVNEDLTKNTTITYHTLYGFSAYSLQEQRFYYTFKGLEYNGVVYYISGQDYVSSDNKTLSDAIKMQQNKTLDMTAVWECQVPNVRFEFVAHSKYSASQGEEIGCWVVYGTCNGSENVELRQKDVSVFFMDKTSIQCYDLFDSIYDIFVNDYTNLHVFDRELNAYSVSYAKEAYLIVDGKEIAVFNNDPEKLHFASIMSCIKSEFGSFDGIEEIAISLMFTKGEKIA